MTKTRKPSAVVTEAAEAIAKAAGKTPTPAPAANAELKPRITMSLTTGKIKVVRPSTRAVKAQLKQISDAAAAAATQAIVDQEAAKNAPPVTVVPEGASGAAAAETIRATVEAKAAAKSKADRDSLKATVVTPVKAKLEARVAAVKTPTALKAYTPRSATTSAGATVKVTKAAKSPAPAVKGDAVTQLTAASNKPAATGARPRGLLSAPPADMPLVINEEAASRISKGFTAEMLAMARRLVRASKSKTFTRAQLLAKYEGAGHTRGKLMDAFYAGTERGVYVPAA